MFDNLHSNENLLFIYIEYHLPRMHVVEIYKNTVNNALRNC